MWTVADKYTMLGVGFGIWGCVIGNPAIAIILSVISVGYFCASMYNTFKGE